MQCTGSRHENGRAWEGGAAANGAVATAIVPARAGQVPSSAAVQSRSSGQRASAWATSQQGADHAPTARTAAREGA
jgi:hypothetical protein